ncbi:MAG TPA: glycoside hydrolase family 97 protein [Blastocatellia bacterium]|nr:glycoside hydrolase family 97 protein [Blastocatellia bacterium]
MVRRTVLVLLQVCCLVMIVVASSPHVPGYTNPTKSEPADHYKVQSPDGRIEIDVDTREGIRYNVSLSGTNLLQSCELSLDVNHKTLGPGCRVKKSSQKSQDHQIEPQIKRKSAKIHEAYNELRLEMEADYAVVFRAYNEGAAYRWETSLADREVKIYGEVARFNFAADCSVFYPKEDSFFSHNERRFINMPLKSVSATDIASVPAVIDARVAKIAVADADVEGYPGLWLRGNGDNSLSAVFPPFPLKEQLFRDRDLRVTRAADYIAVTTGTRTFPWRVLGIAQKDSDLLTNQIVYLLAKPSQVQDTSWIRPGKVAWDWWNANNIYGVDFKSGINTATYKYYIDFAAKYGIEYVILDEGWYKLGNLMQVSADIDVQELADYAKQKHVGVILWVVWKTLDDQLEAALNQFERWGIKGIKVDFMQRDDQPIIDFYHKICREAAKRKMLVDFHGAIRPATMTRTWPNLLSTEGVQGLEHCKWSDATNPEHDVTIPFTRMFLGPMDYTPGAMNNASKSSFAHVFERPMSMGTRCHQLAMYVVFESPLQMLADSPSNYLREPEAMQFLAPVPTVWDETLVLDSRIGDYVIVARRSGQVWYVGAMTDWTARELDVDFSFLPEGAFTMESYQDGTNASRFGSDYKRVASQVSRSTKLKIKLAEGGGWAARIHR